jgi:hypothetical protein
MSLDATLIKVNAGSVLFDTGDSNTRIGFRIGEARLSYRERMEVVPAEEFGEFPLDAILLGGPVILTMSAIQWDAETRLAIGKQYISGSKLQFGTGNIGRLMTSISGGTLTYTPDNVGDLKITSATSRAIPFREGQLDMGFGYKKWTEFALTWLLLPPAAGGVACTLEELASP